MFAQKKKVISLIIIFLLITMMNLAFAVETNGITENNLEITENEEYLQSRLEEINEIMLDLYSGRNSKDNTIKKLNKMGIQPGVDFTQDDGSGFTILSESDNVTLYNPAVMYDSNVGKWFATASFGWKSTDYWKKDAPFSILPNNVWNNVGGLDGFGLYFDKQISRHSQAFTVKSNYNESISYTNPKGYQYGVAWEKQDKMKQDYNMNFHYDWHFGSSSLYFTPNQTGTYALQSGICHTWNSTSININGIYVWGISWNPSTSANMWDVNSPHVAYFTP